MKRIAIAATCAMSLALACDGAKDDAAAKESSAAATGTPAPTGESKAPPAATGSATPPKADPPPAPTGPTASGAFRMPGEPGYDCGRLLTRTEIQTTCGTELKPVIIDTAEGRHEHTKCSRRWRSPSERRTVSMIVGKYDKPPTRPEAATDIAGVGDTTYAWAEERAPQIFWYTARVQKDEWIMEVRSIVTDAGTPLCSLEQLGQLGAKAIDRLQQSG